MEDRIIFLPDLHTPYNIPLDPVFRFVQDFKPTVLILGGDCADFTSVSTWVADQSRALIGGTIMEDYQKLRKVVFEPLQKILSPSCKRIYQKGNHERWVDLAIERTPNGRGTWEIERNIPKSWEILQENVPFKAGPNLVYIHGTYTNEFHAKKTVLAYHSSVIYGHLHTIQTHMLVSPIDSDKFYKASCVGCLCHLNPHYNRNRPNAWVNGFSYAYVDKKTGTFNDFTPIIVKGNFWAEGRRYR